MQMFLEYKSEFFKIKTRELISSTKEYKRKKVI